MTTLPLESLFSSAGGLSLVGWLALALVPLKYRAPRVVAVIAAVAIAMLYVGLIGAFWIGSSGGFGSLAAVAQLFEHPGLLLAGWVHYLAFDLLVGLWERDEARRVGLAQWALVPCLALTFLFGPLGWLVFLAVRAIHQRTQSLVAATAS